MRHWRIWLPPLVAVPICVGVLQAWLAPAHLASWLMLWSLCG